MCACFSWRHHMITACSSLNSVHPLSYFHQLGSGAHGSRPRGTCSFGDELEAVKGQVQTECNALRDLFARTTTAVSNPGPQYDRKLNHREWDTCRSSSVEASSTTVSLRFGWRTVRQSCLAIDRVVRCWEKSPKLEKFEDNSVAILERTFWDVQQLGGPMAAALITCTRGEVATLVRRVLSVSPGDGLQAWHAVTQRFKPRSVVEQAASMARLTSTKRTKNVNMQW